MVAENAVEIELLHEWMGTPPGTCKKVWEHVARELVGRGTAKYHDDFPILSPTSDVTYEVPMRKKTVLRGK